MDLSICIPVYRFDPSEFVQALHRQGMAGSFNFEILLFDDASGDASLTEKLKKLDELKHVRVQFLEKNHGRSAIRNLLAKEAKGEYLLFSDCDAAAPDDHFILRYAEQFRKADVIYGGRTYPPDPKAVKKEYRLRYQYGVKREVSAADERQKKPFARFMTNNYVISRTMALELPFDETLKGYGHEDTLLGKELREKYVTILHIDNPLHHIGLETAEEFLNKTKEGIRNLSVLYDRGMLDKRDSGVIRAYEKIKRSGFRKWMMKNLGANAYGRLKNGSVNLRMFDLWKLSLFIQEQSSSKGR